MTLYHTSEIKFNNFDITKCCMYSAHGPGIYLATKIYPMRSGKYLYTCDVDTSEYHHGDIGLTVEQTFEIIGLLGCEQELTGVVTRGGLSKHRRIHMPMLAFMVSPYICDNNIVRFNSAIMKVTGYKGAIVDADGADHVVAFDADDVTITNIRSYSLYD